MRTEESTQRLSNRIHSTLEEEKSLFQEQFYSDHKTMFDQVDALLEENDSLVTQIANLEKDKIGAEQAQREAERQVEDLQTENTYLKEKVNETLEF